MLDEMSKQVQLDLVTAAKRRSRSTTASTDAIFDAVKPVARGIAETFGAMCEVVVHDYRDPSHSVIHVAGDVTHRHVGQSASPIGLRMIAQGNEAADEYNYITRAPNGRILKSTTVLLRDAGEVVGALCINFDITELRQLTHNLGQIVGEGLAQSPEDVVFNSSSADVIAKLIDEAELKLGASVERMSRDEKLQLLETLEHKGVFALRGSVSTVAQRLGVSRATAYNYLNRLRADREDGSGGNGSDGLHLDEEPR
jgi:predicted transcriptional regulator YheO